MSKRPPVKVGNGAKAAAARRGLFREAYLSNGGNATQAAITAGYSAKTAKAAGSRLLTCVDVSTAIAARVAALQEEAELNTENILRELGRIALFDPATLYDKDGKLLSIQDMPPATRAVIASIDVDQIVSGEKIIGTTNKLKLHDKNPAIEKAMRHLGLFEKDNRQRPPVHVTISLVG